MNMSRWTDRTVHRLSFWLLVERDSVPSENDNLHVGVRVRQTPSESVPVITKKISVLHKKSEFFY